MARIVWSPAGRDSGRFVPEDRTQIYRELILGNYRIIDLHTESLVTIVTVIHGARILRFPQD